MELALRVLNAHRMPAHTRQFQHEFNLVLTMSFARYRSVHPRLVPMAHMAVRGDSPATFICIQNAILCIATVTRIPGPQCHMTNIEMCIPGQYHDDFMWRARPPCMHTGLRVLHVHRMPEHVKQLSHESNLVVTILSAR